LTFNDFNFDDRLVEGLVSMGYKTPTSIQEKAIPYILNNKDIIACAQTGTGKTGAYILPILHKIVQSEKRHLNTIIIAPTRELAQQIDQQIEGFAYFLSVSSIPVYGGGSGSAWDQQKKAMQEGADIIIATPGRLIAQLTSGSMDLTHVKHLVLDEADRMLDMGFYDDILRIISYLPKATLQTILFSATMPPKIRTLANKILKEPEEVTLALSKPAEGILQQIYPVYDAQKTELVKHLLTHGQYNSIIIFSSTKETVKNLGRELQKSNIVAKAFHSDLEQEERESLLRAFKAKQLQVLIGTDVLSRGIDVEGIDLVINYDVPPDPEDYIHRIGRTARAAATGTAITFVNQKDLQKFYRIQNLIGTNLTPSALPEALGEAPVLNLTAESKPKKKFKKGYFKNQNKKSGNFKPRPQGGSNQS
jgi:superfamily II DNA/RNA helicase